MRFVSLIIAVIAGVATVGLWALANRPVSEPQWPARIQGFAFSPYHRDQDAVAEEFPTEDQIEADLKILGRRSRAVRTYTTDDAIGKVPEIAARHHIKVMLGAWVDAREDQNRIEVDRVSELAKRHANVIRVIVGNEVVLRGDVPIEKLTGYLDEVRRKLRQPVSTAEPWHVWLDHPELVEHVDYLAVHMLPYWEGVAAEQAIPYIDDKVARLKKAFPGKPIVLAEVGWPSNGRTRDAAVASEANQAMFLRRFLQHAERKGYVYYLMEAFDQPWKAQSEGAVGAYWGVFNVDREAKFPFRAPIVRIPEWRVLAGVAIVLALVMMALLYIDSRAPALAGRGFQAVVAYAMATGLVWVGYEYSQQYMSFSTILVGCVLAIGMGATITMLLSETHEWVEAQWATTWRRRLSRAGAAGGDPPKVSIHVPCYNEPPDMVIRTLDALAALDYPNFEVLVIDNNTPEESVWRPVEEHCRHLGGRFRFFHVAPLSGFKAGALNFALRHTAGDAQIIAAIDSDYLVQPGWLKELVPAFGDPQIGIVQAPQDYRDGEESAFKAACYNEYAGFFAIGMVTRNERNAIIQHGTMTLVRRSALEGSGGWGEWCITEDAELGLRLFAAGWDAIYVPCSYGRGVIPDTFRDFRLQRFRWVCGAMQILRRYMHELFSRKHSTLSIGQRYHFIAGWLPWVADGANLLVNLSALAWSVAMIAAPDIVDPPLVIFSIMPMSLFIFRIAKSFDLYRNCVGATLRQTIAASLAGLSLSHTVARAVISGLFVQKHAFFRTPKHASRHALFTAVREVREEGLMAVGLSLAAVAVAHIDTMDSPDLRVWIIVLVVQTVPYWASVVMSLVSALPLSARCIGIPGEYLGRVSGRSDEAGLPVVVEKAG
jgi:exo-beta-1,3-glucanase (GH17 family)/cellulose synthase/poly-beta-1,6-N-acetylglucosamine synthase-like glycosyltransferase